MIILIGLLSVFYFWGVPRIPFHPDESTYLFMSSDFEALLQDPLSLAWQPGNEEDLRQYYRAVDAPLTRYVLGIGRSIAGLKALPADWDWSKSWEENQQAGALPDERLLTAGRVAVTLLLLLSLVFIYLTGNLLGGRSTGLLAALLLGTNALVLLHGRRAMTEGVLTLGVTLALWSILKAGRRPWLAGLGAALAFNAKHTGLALLPVGLLAACWPLPGSTFRWGKTAAGLAQYLGVFALLTLALNPFLWSKPVQAVQAAWSSRQTLVQRQLADIRRLAPELLLATPSRRAAVLVANLYLVEPAFAEVENYQAETAGAELAYLAIPGHNTFRSPLWGGVLLTLTLAGMIIAITRLRRLPADERRNLVLVLIATAAQVVGLIWLVPLPWQRYVVAVVPYACLWIGYCLNSFIEIQSEAG